MIGATHVKIGRASDGQARKAGCARVSRIGTRGTPAVTADIAMASLIDVTLETIVQVLIGGRMAQHFRREDGSV